MIIIISAMSNDRIIGSGDGMPWSIPEEYAQFLRFVEGQSVIMGSRSFEIFGKDLVTTRNFVVSRKLQSVEDGEVCRSLEDALTAALAYPEDVFIAGGGSIYSQSLGHADKMYLSFIKGVFEGDTWFPVFQEDNWHITLEEDHPDFEFVVYEKVETF